MTKKVSQHPIQPLQMEGQVLRFKRNHIVEHMLKVYPGGLNALYAMDFTAEDFLQLNQLIGYSHSGIPNCNEEVWQSALAVYEQGIPEAEARANHLREELAALKKGMRKAVARLYGIHVDDLGAA